MKSFAFEQIDDGRLILNKDYAPLFRHHNLATFASLMNYTGGKLAKGVLQERVTTRFVLDGLSGQPCAFYIKRHHPAPWKEYIKPLLRFRRPLLGAMNEWNALIRFHASGIATMIPVALGRSGRRSFLVTESLEDCCKLSHWVNDHLAARSPEDSQTAHRLIERLAQLARTMHKAGAHHQDFYLNHLLVPKENVHGNLYVIDLGRAQFRHHLARRWIIKDLAQLNYSARLVTPSDRHRFFKAYIGGPLKGDDRRLARQILKKSHAIARHSKRNGL